MRTLISALVLLGTSTAFAAPKPNEDEAIKARVVDFIATFNKGDAKATAAFFADDGVLVNPVGVKGTGTAEIEKVISDDLTHFIKGAKMEMKVVEVRPAGKDSAWVEMEHTLVAVKTPDGKTMNMNLHVPCLFVKKGKNWLIAEARPYAYLPTPPAAPVAAKK
jgi:uncharacterized protein (TIGR02246 family)